MPSFSKSGYGVDETSPMGLYASPTSLSYNNTTGILTISPGYARASISCSEKGELYSYTVTLTINAVYGFLD